MTKLFSLRHLAVLGTAVAVSATAVATVQSIAAMEEDPNCAWESFCHAYPGVPGFPLQVDGFCWSTTDEPPQCGCAFYYYEYLIVQQQGACYLD
jgi:hypothetical protein